MMIKAKGHKHFALDVTHSRLSRSRRGRQKMMEILLYISHAFTFVYKCSTDKKKEAICPLWNVNKYEKMHFDVIKKSSIKQRLWML